MSLPLCIARSSPAAIPLVWFSVVSARMKLPAFFVTDCEVCDCYIDCGFLLLDHTQLPEQGQVVFQMPVIGDLAVLHAV
jgi:hypothetical protein